VPYWRFFTLPRDREIGRHLQALRHAVDEFIADARGRLDARPGLREQPTNLIEAMVAARDAPGSALTDQDVSGNVLTMLLAGEDTTANTLAWTIRELHRHPEAAHRAAGEADTVLGNAHVATRHEDLGRLDFIEACTHETMRLRPVAPINIQQAVHDTAVGGVALPAGALVMCLMRPAAVDERHFAQAAAFRPERWLEGLSASSSKRVAMPFGAGPRICPGRYLALLEIKMAAAMLLAHFDIDAVTTPDGAEAAEQMSFTMMPVGLRMRLRERR